jgi:hypothetical protein
VIWQHDIEHQMEKISIKKSELSFARKSFLGLLTGLWMALAGCFSLSVAGNTCWTLAKELHQLIFDAGGVGSDIVELIPILPRLVYLKNRLLRDIHS